MKQDLISVIVPIYNVKKYLEECISSIINQTYKNLEIILVDDGSKDNSPRICDEISKKDSRIKVIHKENGGISDTRNVGISNSTGKYIQFIDSDDFMEDNMIETLHKDIVENGADVTMCSYYLFKDGIKTTDATYEKEIYNKEQILQEILLDEKIRSYAWNKLFKRNLFDGIKFPKGKVFEDIYIIPLVLEKAEKVVFNNIPLYYYRQREGSILHKQTNELRLEYIKAALKINKEIENNFPNLKQYCAYNIAHITIKTYNDIGFFDMKDLMDNNIVKDLYIQTKKIFENKELEAFIIKNSNSVKKLHYYYMLTDLDKYIENNRCLPVIYPEYGNLLLAHKGKI